MAPPVSINHDARQITFQIGKLIPPTEARADLHRLLDSAIDAIALNAALPEEPFITIRTGTYPDGDPRNSMGLAGSYRKTKEAHHGENQD